MHIDWSDLLKAFLLFLATYLGTNRGVKDGNGHSKPGG